MWAIIYWTHTRNFKTRYKEHIRDIKNNRYNIGYAGHILNTGHSYGPMEDMMEIIKVLNKGSTMDTIERYHIYIANQNGILLNGTHLHNRNPIFDVLHKHQQKKVSTTPYPYSHPHQQMNTRTVCIHISWTVHSEQAIHRHIPT
jgi:hypothetical protein